MRYKQLGSTGLTVSILGFGAAPLGGEYGSLDPDEGRRTVDAAIDAGIDFFDVSPYYGRTLAEERLGRWLEGKRDRVVLSTKVGRYDRDPPEGFDFSAPRVLRSVEESLARLRTDVIDVYLAHDIEFAPLELILEETLPAMHRLREQGKVRFIGVSGFPLEVLRAAVEGFDLDVVLSYCHYDLLNTRLSTVLAPAAAARSVGLISASPLHMGVLTPQGPPPWHPAPPEVQEAGRRAAAWCEQRGLDLAEVALRFALDSPDVASTFVGIRTAAELTENLRALEPDPDPSATAELRALLAPVQDREWPSGLWSPGDEEVG
jgi:L-galactose dehydrogenase